VRIDPRRPDIAYNDTSRSMIVFPGLSVLAGTLISLPAVGMHFG
jgi:hypothetical protein